MTDSDVHVLTWKTPIGFSSYEAADWPVNDNLDQVRSIDRTLASGRAVKGQMLTTRIGTNGYPVVDVTDDTGRKRKGFPVHTLVLLAFAGEPEPGQEAEHRHDNPLDNRWPEELFWSTRSANERRKFDNGTPKPVPPPRAPRECRNFERCGNHVTPGTGTRCEHCRAEFSRGCAVLLADGRDPEEVGRLMEYPAIGTLRMAVKYGGLVLSVDEARVAWPPPGDPSPTVMATVRHILRLGRRSR